MSGRTRDAELEHESSDRLVELYGLGLTERERQIAKIAWHQGARWVGRLQSPHMSPYERADFPVRPEQSVKSGSGVIENALAALAASYEVHSVRIVFGAAYTKSQAALEIRHDRYADAEEVIGKGSTLLDAVETGCQSWLATAEREADKARKVADQKLKTFEEVRAMLAEVKS